jgi:hypothetical protein
VRMSAVGPSSGSEDGDAARQVLEAEDGCRDARHVVEAEDPWPDGTPARARRAALELLADYTNRERSSRARTRPSTGRFRGTDHGRGLLRGTIGRGCDRPGPRRNA